MTGLSARLGRIPWRRGLPWPLLLFALFASLGAAMFGAVAGGMIGLRGFGVLPTGSSLPEMLGQSLLAVPCLFGAVMMWPPQGKLTAKLGIRPLGWADAGIAVAACVAVLVVGGALTDGWQMLLDRCGIPYQEKQDLLLDALAASPVQLVALGAVVIVAVPVTEEIFFRRILFGLLRPLGAWRAILLTSLVFSLVHGFLLGVPALFLMGLGFQLVYLLRRNLAAAILTHGLVNLCALVGTFFET